jgi:hypothetical protein
MIILKPIIDMLTEYFDLTHFLEANCSIAKTQDILKAKNVDEAVRLYYTTDSHFEGVE